MRAMVLPAQAPISERPLERRRVPIPEPGRGEVLIIVTACAICRTDLHIAEGDLPLLRAPLVPGHQAVGRVLRAGPGDGGPLPGTRVGVAWLRWTCGTCAYCTSARENLCARAEFTGYHADGGYAEYAVVPQAYVYPLPPVFGDAEAAPLLCAGIIGYRALKIAAVAPGGTLGVYGFGSSAHITLQIAVARGCTVYVCTREPAHRELARALGAAWVGESNDRMPTPADGIVVFAPARDLVPPAFFPGAFSAVTAGAPASSSSCARRAARISGTPRAGVTSTTCSAPARCCSATPTQRSWERCSGSSRAGRPTCCSTSRSSS